MVLASFRELFAIVGIACFVGGGSIRVVDVIGNIRIRGEEWRAACLELIVIPKACSFADYDVQVQNRKVALILRILK